ncbi:MAG: hypothetical protein K2M63_11375 [Muribaculaceae bacterium]|nr:hypothetical protein [Muribaculaceae bacterium]
MSYHTGRVSKKGIMKKEKIIKMNKWCFRDGDKNEKSSNFAEEILKVKCKLKKKTKA